MITYLFACFVMGFGIAIDVALASIARAAELRSPGAMRRWVARITATHVAFPMIGYYGAIPLERVAFVRPVLGVVAFLLIALFLWRMLRGLLVPSASMPLAAEPGWTLVLAVSWDALWSGPAKSAQAVGWSPLEVALSFPLAGLVVAAAAIAGTALAGRLRDNARRRTSSARRLARFEQAAILLEVAIFAYFAFLALLTFSVGHAEPVPPATAAALMSALLVQLALGQRLASAMRAQLPARPSGGGGDADQADNPEGIDPRLSR